MTHNVCVKRYSVTPQTVVIGTNGSYGNDSLLISLSEDWNELDIFLTMYPIGSSPITLKYTNKEIPIPDIVYNKGKTEIVVSGFGNNRCMNSLPIVVRPKNTLRRNRK